MQSTCSSRCTGLRFVPVLKSQPWPDAETSQFGSWALQGEFPPPCWAPRFWQNPPNLHLPAIHGTATTSLPPCSASHFQSEISTFQTFSQLNEWAERRQLISEYNLSTLYKSMLTLTEANSRAPTLPFFYSYLSSSSFKSLSNNIH